MFCLFAFILNVIFNDDYDAINIYMKCVVCTCVYMYEAHWICFINVLIVLI